MTGSETLRWLVAALEQAAVPYMVVGSFASSVYGRPRTTHDLDVVIDPTAASLDAFLGALDMDRFYVDADVARDALRRRTMFNVIDSTTGWKVDLVIRKQRPFSVEEFRRKQSGTILGVPVQLATAEDVVIAKLEWALAGGSARQLDDVRGILAAHGDRLDLAYVTAWAETLGLADIWGRARAAG
ncbi:MAG: nucleotidyltransferase family protein [Kofleriaceae bacterium]|nr:MAG: nucleotidyltransferase family protein [Kofleriaceae bacterium]MBZ0237523.1 hypothetical protein [Kofleriaceae bacterium]